MATAHQIRDLIAQATTGTARPRVPRAYLREATLRAVRYPGTVTLARDLKSPEA